MDLKQLRQQLRQQLIAETKQKIKRSINFNNFIVQAVNTLDDLTRTANTLSKRLREWYELYNPEFSRKTPDHETFIRAILEEKDKKEENSMGAELKKNDLDPMLKLAIQADTLYKLKSDQEEYIESIMKENCPNITAVAGAIIGARLLELAGNLKRLMRFPASTIQLLGAEKALFRHMKTKARAPKHGVIINHPLIEKARKDQVGKVARALADKISLAAKLDYFKGEFMGDQLREELEEKFRN